MKEVDPWVIIEKLRAQHSQEILETWRPLVAEYRERCEELQSRLESLEKDAARYQWMKEHDMTGLRIYKSCRTPEEIEAAIDEAMKG